MYVVDLETRVNGEKVPKWSTRFAWNVDERQIEKFSNLIQRFGFVSVPTGQTSFRAYANSGLFDVEINVFVPTSAREELIVNLPVKHVVWMIGGLLTEISLEMVLKEVL